MTAISGETNWFRCRDVFFFFGLRLRTSEVRAGWLKYPPWHLDLWLLVLLLLLAALVYLSFSAHNSLSLSLADDDDLRYCMQAPSLSHYSLLKYDPEKNNFSLSLSLSLSPSRSLSLSLSRSLALSLVITVILCDS
jgi:hypothetical protein